MSRRDDFRGRGPPPIEGMYSLKVDNISFRSTPEDLRHMFERCGDVGDVYIPRDYYSRQSKGFAFIRFYSQEDCDYAIEKLDGKMMDGRELRVAMARHARPDQVYGGGGGGGGRRYSGGYRSSRR